MKYDYSFKNETRYTYQPLFTLYALQRDTILFKKKYGKHWKREVFLNWTPCTSMSFSGYQKALHSISLMERISYGK